MDHSLQKGQWQFNRIGSGVSSMTLFWISVSLRQITYLLGVIFLYCCFAYFLIIKIVHMQSQTKRAPLIKSQDENFYMTRENLHICNKNQDRYTTPELNQAFQLQYYGFFNIANLEPYLNLNTLYLNNNVIGKIENLGHLNKLVTLNLANNRITKIEGLGDLREIFILDLSGNKIEKVEGLDQLQKLATFNLSGNLLSKPDSIAELTKNKVLTCLNISNNPIPQEKQLYDYLEQIPLLTLFLKDTKFSRGVPSYRKQTICKLKQLTFLDERPVTKDERMMAQAWKQGRLQAQKQARKLIQETKDEKNKKIFQEMMERSAKIDKLRDQLFAKLTVHENQQLQSLKLRLGQQKKKQKLDQFEIGLLQRKIEEIKMYLKLFRVDVNDMPVGQTREVPNNLCERHEPDAIYIYGVSEQQLPKIRQVYYPDDPRPLIAKDFEKKQELRWIENYNEILESVCKQYLTKSELILPVFNIKVHQFDSQYLRKARRFKQEEIKGKIEKYSKAEADHEGELLHETENNLNLLD